MNNTFLRHLEVLKRFYFTPHPYGLMVDEKSTPMMLALLLNWELDAQ